MRIVVLGNSFTYGWGLNDDETWPVYFQDELNKRGINAEIINLGTPGTSAQQCQESLEKALPLLDPDLVVLAILQGGFLKTHDPGEMHGENLPKSEAQKIGRMIHANIQQAIKKLQPNFYRLVLHASNREFVSANKNRALSKKLAITYLSKYEKVPLKNVFDGLPIELKRAFLNGDLNSSLIPYIVEQKSFFNELLDLDESVDARISKSFARIKEIVAAQNKTMLVLSIPYVAYGNKEQSNLLKELGFEISPTLHNNKEIELRCKSIVEKNGIHFLSVTDEFFKNNDAGLFIKYDGHFSKLGAALFARLLRERLMDQSNVLGELCAKSK